MKLPFRAYWVLLAGHIRPQRGRFTLMALLLLGSIGLRILNPQIMRSFIDAALSGAVARQLATAALAFVGIALLQQGVSVAVVYLSENVAWTATNDLRAELADHCLKLDMGFHNDHTPGELIERIDGDVSELANFFSQFAVMLAGNLIMLVGILIVLFFEDWRAGLVFSLYALLAVTILNRVRDLAMPHENARRQAEADLFGFVEESLAGAEDLRSSGAVDFSLRELFRHQKEILRHNRKGQFKVMLINLVMGGIIILGNVLSAATGYLLFSAGVVTIGTVYLFIHYINLLEEPLWHLTHEVQSFQTIGACIERLIALRQIQPKIIDNGTDKTADQPPAALPVGPLGLSFKNVSFSYASGEPILQDLSFKLLPGRVLGLLGRTGSGKTTLARLVFRLYDPSTGEIWLDGSQVRTARLSALRQRVAMVTQEVQIYRASVRDNLTFFDRRISDDQILAAIDALELDDWLASLPAGLDTQLEGGGRSLSAGEAQLLAFTRVFLRDPGLVILDEASSRLDPATEQRIERAIDCLLQDRTAIIIAHRLGTVQRADEVMILDEGRVCEHGPRSQLAGDQASLFYQLLQTGLEEILA